MHEASHAVAQIVDRDELVISVVDLLPSVDRV